jgi:hypothetical protein
VEGRGCLWPIFSSAFLTLLFRNWSFDGRPSWQAGQQWQAWRAVWNPSGGGGGRWEPFKNLSFDYVAVREALLFNTG